MNQNIGSSGNVPFVPGVVDTVSQPYYDHHDYAAVGQTSLTFFQVPVSGTKTFADTNMELAGMFGYGINFTVTNIQIQLFPGVNPAEAVGAQAAGKFLNDIYTFAKGGYLEFKVGQNTKLREGPLGNFPTRYHLDGFAAIADTTTAAAASQTRISYGYLAGDVRMIKPVKITSGVNFSVTLNWPTAIALPSGAAMRVGLRLGGVQERQAQ